MKVIRVFNAQPVKIPYFKSPLNVDYAKFQKKFDFRIISRELL